ncbi:MAG: NADH dehydrogenase subunit [Halobacteriota archaeon]
MTATADLSNIADVVQRAGVAGAGGAGFPSYAKWTRIDEVDHLMVNHQESEPNYYIDKWLGKEYPDLFADLFDRLLDELLQTVIIGAKEKNREEWMGPLEEAAPGTVYLPDDLPIDADEESGVVYTYTVDTYQLGMESVLLNMAVDTIIGRDLPMDHGFIVQNTETLYNIRNAIEDGTPVTDKWVHVGGDVPTHRFLEVPVGTPASDVLEAGGLEGGELPEGAIMADGGPGWCFECDLGPETFGVTKRTNALLVLDRATAEEYTFGDGRINLLEERGWGSEDDEREPSERLEPEEVHIPLITNPDFEGIVAPSEPVVEVGDAVTVGDVVAEPAEGISNFQHASIDGTVTDITDRHVVVARD